MRLKAHHFAVYDVSVGVRKVSARLVKSRRPSLQVAHPLQGVLNPTHATLAAPIPIRTGTSAFFFWLSARSSPMPCCSTGDLAGCVLLLAPVLAKPRAEEGRIMARVADSIFSGCV